MSEFEIDFEWPVAKYVLQPATTEEVRKTCFQPGIPEAEKPLYLGRIIPTGKPKHHRPKKEAMELAVRVLVECKETSFREVALKVARVVGALVPKDPKGDPVAGWHLLALRLQEMFEGKFFVDGKEYTWPQPETHYKGRLGIFLVPGKDNKPTLALRPTDLHDALILYAARMIATGTAFNICENCKTPFLSGGARGRNKKRGDARFCSDECRWRYHNESRRKAR